MLLKWGQMVVISPVLAIPSEHPQIRVEPLLAQTRRTLDTPSQKAAATLPRAKRP